MRYHLSNMGFLSRLLLVAATFSALAFGQASAINGQITGTVTDASGAPVADAKVKATNLQTGYSQDASTIGSGLFRLTLLPLGTYSLTVDASGFAPYKQTGIEINAGSSATIDVPLQVKGTATEIVVSAAAPIVDSGRTDQYGTLSANAVQNLPLVSRNPFNFILQQPNVSGRGNTEFGVPRKLNANGFAGRINYQLDGSNNVQSDRAGIRLMPISQTWVQEVQSVNNGFAPEFGNTVGMVFNTVTRSGTNDLHGDAAYFFRRTPMSARPALLAFNRPTPEVNVDAWYGTAGGRLVKDRVFWFGSYEKVKRDLPAPVTVPAATVAQLGLPANFADAIPFSQNVKFFLGKVDVQLGQKNRIALRYNGHQNDSPYNNATIGGLFLVDRSYNFVDRSHGGAAQLVSILSPNMVNELRFQTPIRSQQQQRFSATGTGPAITIPGVANFGNSLDAGFVYEEMTPEITDNFTYNLGKHTLKVGFGSRFIRDTQVAQTSANYTFPSIAAYLAAKAGTAPRGYTSFVQSVGEPSLKYNSTFWNFFAQDSWKPRANLTVIYGVRYDIYQPPDANTGAPFEFSRKFRTDKNNIAPRVGVAYKFRKSVIRGSGGIFYDPFQTDLYRKALLNNGLPQIFNISVAPAQAIAPSFPNVFSGIPTGFTPTLQDITTVSPDFASLYSGNANVTFSREITDDIGLDVSYLYTRGNRLPVFRNINVVPTAARLGDGRPIFGTQRYYNGFGNIVSGESVGQSKYHGMNATLRKRFSRGWEMFGTYTLSKAEDDAPEQNNIDSGAFLLSDPTNRARDWGPSLVDRRHAFSGHFVWNPTYRAGSGMGSYLLNNNKLSLFATAQSGEVFNVGSNRILNGDASTAATFQRPLNVGRNSLRAPSWFELNARYSRVFPIGERMRAEFIAESTNILNRTNVTGINSTAAVDAAGAITTQPSQAWTGAADQRLIQLGLRFSF